MADLHLDSLEIKNFRTFKHLTIERLGRVNLIVGKNGVGKTALLEALRVYANQGFPPLIQEILESRDEIEFELARGRENIQGWYWAIRHLFYDRPDVRKGASLSIGSIEDLSIEIRPYTSSKTGIGVLSDLRFVAQMDAHEVMNESLQEFHSFIGTQRKFAWISNAFVEASGLSDSKIAGLWDDIVLTDKEEIVLKVMRVIAPEVQRLNFILSEPKRIPVVKLESQSFPATLRSLGEGMTRLLGMALALVNASNGLLLIDEIESGLHYSVQPDMWRLVFETAKRLNVQVFATTHSLDCLRAFEQAASEHDEEDSLLVSLRRHQEDPEKIVAVLAGKEELETIVRSHIEVR